MKTILFSVCLLCAFTFAQAQTDVDALRYSFIQPISSARSAAMGGSFSALGADISCLSTNPAGMGLYRSSELTISPMLNTSSYKTTFGTNNQSNTEFSNTFRLSNWGMVFTKKLGKDDDLPEWKYFTFSLGGNTNSLFNDRVGIAGRNNYSSISDVAIAESNGISSDNLTGFANSAWNTFLLDSVYQGNIYTSSIKSGVDKFQSQNIIRDGKVSESMINFSGNYANNLFVGTSLGIASIKYSERNTFTESDDKQESANFKSLTYINNFTTQGTAFTFRLGAIYMPAPFLRLGASFQTRSSYSLTDNYSSSLNVSFDTTRNRLVEGTGVFDYFLKTPAKVNFSVGVILKKWALLSAEVERMNYGNAFLSPSGSFVNANNLIANKYKAVWNFKTGAEIKLKPFALRLGYSKIANAFESNVNANNELTNYSIGVGLKYKAINIDIAHIVTVSNNEKFYMYSPDYIAAANLSATRNTTVLTVGYRWK
jgi:hypothetical protein